MLELNLVILAILVSSGAADPLLEGLYGIHGANQVTMCLGTMQCEGAIWMEYWVVVRESCINETEIDPILVWKGNITCSQVNEVNTSPRQVVARYLLPYDESNNLVLFRLSLPFVFVEPLDSHLKSDVYRKLKHLFWEIIPSTTMRPNPFKIKVQQKYYNSHYLNKYSLPIKMFIMTVILPSTLFIIFFMIVIFCTGVNKSKIPYKSLSNEVRGSTQV